EHPVIAVVIADGGERRRVRRQCHRWQGGAIEEEPARQLASEVLRVRGAAPVAAEIQRAAVLEAGYRGLGGGRDRRGAGVLETPHRLARFPQRSPGHAIERSI